MQGETEERPRKRRKKKSKFGYYLYAVVVLLLTVTNITLAILLFTHVQKIEVSGTSVSTDDDIVAWIQEDPLTVNSLYTLWKYNMGSYEQPVYLRDVKVSLNLPWEVQVDVTEKEIISCVKHKESYVYLDEEGLVMEILPEKKEGIQLVENVAVKKAEQFKLLEVKNEKIFSYIKNVTKAVKNEDLAPDRLAWENESMNLYFGEVCVQLGKMNYDVKIAELSGIFKEWEGKAGILHMEHYGETGKKISFELNEVEDTEESVSEEDAEAEVQTEAENE